MSLLLLSTLLCGAAAGLCVEAALLLRPAARREAALADRLTRLGAPAPAPSAHAGIARERPLSLNPALDRLLSALPGPAALSRAMQAAGLRGTPSRFLGAVALAAAAVMLLCLAAGAPWLAVLSAALVLAAPLLLVEARRRSRLRAFTAQLPDALELLVRTLRAGNALTAGMRLVAEEMANPLAAEFAMVHEEVRLGRDLSESLEALRQRVDTADVRLLCTSLLIQRETGGNLVEVLGNLAALMRRRFAFAGKLSALTAEGRLSALVLSALPPAMVAILFVLNPPYARMLLQPGPLRVALVCAGALQLVGAFWIRSIVSVRY